MKVLLDENVPPRVRLRLVNHQVYTVEFQGWKGLKNGVLLSLAEAAAFEVFITVDQNLAYQQKIAASKIGFIVLSSNLWPRIAPRIPQLLEALEACTPGSIKR